MEDTKETPEKTPEKEVEVPETLVETVMSRVSEGLRQENEVKMRTQKQQDDLTQRMMDLVKEAQKSAPGIKDSGSAYGIKIDSKKNESRAFWHYMRTGDRAPYLKANNDLTEGGDAEGLAVVPPDFYARIIERRNEVSIARQAGATVVQTSLFHLDVPVENAATEKFIAQNEKAAITDAEIATDPFITKSIVVHKFQKTMKVSDELLADNKANLEGWMASYFGRAMGLTENEQFLMGTIPVGVVTEAGTGVTTAGYGALTAANLLTLYYSLTQPYRDGAVWVMKGTTEALVRQLTSQYFAFGPTPQGSISTTGLQTLIGPGARVYNSDEMDAMAASKKPVLFGNWQYYMIAEREGLGIRRLNELYAGTGQVGFVATFRVGGAATQTEAFKVLATPTNES